MCGIIGQLAFGELDAAKEKMRQESMIFLGSELLQLTQERGKDATGVSLLFDDGNYIGLKMGIQPIEFIAKFGKSEKEYGGFIRAWRRTKRKANVFLGHCRKTSRGSANNNSNNHPIKVGEIIGIHNGTLDNDEKIFQNLKCGRDGQVDSEAIFRLLHHYSKNGTEPFTLEMMREIVQRLTGTYAVLGMSGNNPYQVCAFRDGKPIDLALVRPLKLVIVSSDKKFIETALFRYNKYGNLYMPDANFPVLRKSDVDYKLLQDDSAVVFDLTTKITAKTEIDDLYDWEKMPRTIVEGYEKTTTTTTYKKPATTINTAAATSTSTSAKEENKTAGFVPAGKSSGSKHAGKVYCKKAQKYVSGFNAEEIEKTKKRGNIELNVTNGEAEDVLSDTDAGNSNGEGPFALDYDDNANTRTLSDPAKILELPPPESSKDDNRDRVELEVTKEDGTTYTVEVDVTVDVEAVEKAEEALKNLELFEGVDEVLEALEIEDETTLESIPVTSLANRMLKAISKNAFIKGYTTRKEEEKPEIVIRKNDGHKDKTAGENIRSLKGLVMMCESVLRMSGVGIREAAIERAVIDAIEGGMEITTEILDRVFKPGDDRNSKIIPIIKKLVANRK